MNAIAPSENPSVVPRSQPIRHTSGWLNLVRKECLDSREALIAGMAIFWLVPAALELVESCLVERRDVFPVALSLLISVGWLYAVIVGAHTVCRDWGKAEENFLLAQPVSARAVIWAKLATGAALVVVVLGIAMAWDLLVIQLPASDTVGKSEWMTIFSVACVVAVGFAVAFAVAVMTRQMLASTVVATLVLVVWAIGPLLSSHLARFWVPALPGHPGASAAMPFVLLAILMFAACVIASVYYSTRERVFRLGNKQLAWTTCLVMLTLFGVAMGEVGNSLQIRDQARLTEPGKAVGWFPWIWMIQRGDRFALAYYDSRSDPNPKSARFMVATFRISEGGYVRDLRRTPIPDVHLLIGHGSQIQGSKTDRLLGLATDKGGHLVVSGKRLRIVDAHENSELETLWRTTLSWPENAEPEVLSHAELALPTGQNFWATEPWRAGRDYVSRYSYLVSAAPSNDGRSGSPRADKLYVFDWSDGPWPQPRLIIPLPKDDASVAVANGKVNVWTSSGHFPDQHVFAAEFDADHPEKLPVDGNWSLKERQAGQWYDQRWYKQWYDWTKEFERFGSGYVQVDQHGDLAYLSDLLGLRVARQIRPGQWKIVGECRASPLSMLFRQFAWPQALDDSLVVENSGRGIIIYDVADPSKPKRLGYFNAVIALWQPTQSVFAVGRYLVVNEYGLITVLDLPAMREPER